MHNSFFQLLSVTCRTTGYAEVIWFNMEKSKKAPEVKAFPTTNKSDNSLLLLSPEVTVNQILHANPHHDRFMPSCCLDAEYFCPKGPPRVRQVNQELRSRPARAVQHKELMQHGEPEGGGATPAGMNLHHQPPDGYCPAETRQSDTRGECCCWDCRSNQCGTTGPANTDTTRWLKKNPRVGVKKKSAKECGIIWIHFKVYLGWNNWFFIFRSDEYNSQLQSDEEDLEPPLPLRSDDEWQHYSPFLPPHHYMHNNGKENYIKYIWHIYHFLHQTGQKW